MNIDKMTDEKSPMSEDAKIINLIKNIIKDNQYSSSNGMSNKKTILRIKEVLEMFNKLNAEDKK